MHPHCGGNEKVCGSASVLAQGCGGPAGAIGTDVFQVPEVCNEQLHSQQNFPMHLVGLFDGRTSGRCVP